MEAASTSSRLSRSSEALFDFFNSLLAAFRHVPVVRPATGYHVARAAQIKPGGSLTFVSGYMAERPQAPAVL